MTILDTLITLSLVLVLGIGMPTVSWRLLQSRSAALISLQTCSLSRMKAMASGQDVSAPLSQFQAQCPGIPMSLNITSFGFKSTGRTRNAGTLNLPPYRITVGVGFGRPQLKAL